MAVEMQEKTVSELIFVYLLSFLVGVYSLLKYLFGLVRHGPTKWLYVKKRNERPAVLDSEEYGTHHWMPLKKTRLKIHYVDSGPKDKPLMLFLHGFPEFWYSWRHQIKEFNKDYRTVAVDMRGFADSDKPSGITQYTMDKLIDDVDQIIDQLGHKSCILVGHDWGAFLAFYYVMYHSAKVDRLICMNVPHPLAFKKNAESGYSQLRLSLYMFLFQNPGLPIWTLRANDNQMQVEWFTGKELGAKPGSFTADDMEAYKYTFNDYSDFCGGLNYYRVLWRYSHPVIPKSKIQVPSLIVWGTNDGYLEKRMAEMSGDYIEDFTLRWVEGASHWVQQEEPEQVNAFMREFLKNKKDN